MVTMSLLVKVLVLVLLQGTSAMTLKDCSFFQYLDSHVETCVNCKETCLNLQDPQCTDHCKDYLFFLAQIDVWKNATGLSTQNAMIFQVISEVQQVYFVVMAILVLLLIAFCFGTVWIWCSYSARKMRACCNENCETKSPETVEAGTHDNIGSSGMEEEQQPLYVNHKAEKELRATSTTASSTNTHKLNAGTKKLNLGPLPEPPPEEQVYASAALIPESANSDINSGSGDAYTVPARLSSQGPTSAILPSLTPDPISNTTPAAMSTPSPGSTPSPIITEQTYTRSGASNAPTTSAPILNLTPPTHAPIITLGSQLQTGSETPQSTTTDAPALHPTSSPSIVSHDTSINSLPGPAIQSVRVSTQNDLYAAPPLPPCYQDSPSPQCNGFLINGTGYPNAYDSLSEGSGASRHVPPMTDIYDEYGDYSSYPDTDYFQSNPNLGEAEKQAAKDNLDSKFWDLLQSKRYIQDVALDSENRLFLLVHNDNVGEASVDVPRYIRDHWSVPQEYIIYPV